MVSYSSCCLVIYLIETRGFWKSCSLNNPRAGVVEHPITVSHCRSLGGRWGLSTVSLRLWSYDGESPALYAAALTWFGCIIVPFCFILKQFEAFRAHSCWQPERHSAVSLTSLADPAEATRQGAHTKAHTGVHGLPLSTGHPLHLFVLPQEGSELLPEFWACWWPLWAGRETTEINYSYQLTWRSCCLQSGLPFWLPDPEFPRACGEAEDSMVLGHSCPKAEVASGQPQLTCSLLMGFAWAGMG